MLFSKRRLKSCVNKFYGFVNLRVVFQNTRRIKSFFPYKDRRFNRSQKSKIVYKASCWDCDAFYIDKTKRRLHDRRGPVRGGLYVPRLNFKRFQIAISEGSHVAVGISSSGLSFVVIPTPSCRRFRAVSPVGIRLSTSKLSLKLITPPLLLSIRFPPVTTSNGIILRS